MLCLPVLSMAQTDETDHNARVAALQAEAAEKAKAAQEAAKAAQEAALAAQQAAEAAAAEAKKLEEKQAEATTVQQEKKTVTGWVVPTQEINTTASKKEKDAEELNKDAKYLSEDAVTMIDDHVGWEYNLNLPGKSAKEIYDAMLEFLTAMTKESNQLERSRVALINEQQHDIVATMQEWLVFSSSFLSLDRAKLNYALHVTCADENLHVTISHISYNYEDQRETHVYKAEEWITDKYTVNKKRTRLYPITGKFRRKTIDRKDEIFKNIETAMKQ